MLTARSLLPLLCVPLLLAIGSACSPSGGGTALVWPKEARLGDTVAMSLDSNHVPTFGPLFEKFDLSVENVTLQIRQGTTVLATVTPRAVFDGLSAPTSLRNETKAGPFLTMVVFDLPTSLSTTFPATTSVRLLVDGVAPAYPRSVHDASVSALCTSI